jgi:hypothetical protein
MARAYPCFLFHYYSLAASLTATGLQAAPALPCRATPDHSQVVGFQFNQSSILAANTDPLANPRVDCTILSIDDASLSKQLQLTLHPSALPDKWPLPPF